MVARRVSTTTKAETTMAIRIREKIRTSMTKESHNMLENKVATEEMKILNMDTRRASTTKEVTTSKISPDNQPMPIYLLVEKLSSIPTNIDLL